MDINNYIKNIFQIKKENTFNDYAVNLFKYQYKHIKVYQKYVDLIGINPTKISRYKDIPFLPIELFRTQKIVSNQKDAQRLFISSGTTNKLKSKHYVADINIYKKSILSSFKLFLGSPREYTILCLIPNPNSFPNSSLAFMCNVLINESNNEKSGFYLNNKQKLRNVIISHEQKKKKYILFGLSFELLNFGEEHPISMKNGIILETGGTKKNKLQITKQDLHTRLKKYFDTPKIYSEYGMAELLSQSYYVNNYYFKSPPWKKILIRDKRNPLKIIENKNRGCINIIDLANTYSCGFIATNDLGCKINDGFNIIGRAQNASERGCNLLI
mgnify:CR=1 FL=1